MELGKRISALRKEKNLSQVQIAEALNLSRQAISRWETGAVVPTLENLEALRKVLDISWEELLGEATANEDQPETVSCIAPPQKEMASPEKPFHCRRKATVLLCTLLLGTFLVWLWFSAPWKSLNQTQAISMDDMEVQEKEEQPEEEFQFDFMW